VPISFDLFLEEIRIQGEALITSAADFDAPVPCCPGWTVRDVVAHTGVVHRHKERIVRERPNQDPEPETAPDADPALRSWYSAGLERLLATLAATDPTDPAFTWYLADQSAGFWYRRMAHETAVHRADVESAFGAVSPWGAALAADGLEEILGPIMCAYTDDPRWEYTPDGRVALIRPTDVETTLQLRLGGGAYGPGWTLEHGAAPDPIAMISAPAWDLDLWAWGRAPADVLSVEGDTSVVDLVRAVAAEAAQ
jgi:uncharacterized protein (TIGR03083 family)